MMMQSMNLFLLLLIAHLITLHSFVPYHHHRYHNPYGQSHSSSSIISRFSTMTTTTAITTTTTTTTQPAGENKEEEASTILLDPQVARSELWRSLSSSHHLHDKQQQQRIDKLCFSLTQSYTPIQTPHFLNLVLKGQWKQLYCSTKFNRASSSMTLTITQTILPYEKEEGVDTTTRFGGDFVNTLNYYYYYPPLQEKVYKGKFEIHGSFYYNPRGDLITTLKEHVLLPDEIPGDGTSVSNNPIIPQDMDAFFLDLQRGVPRHVFDPSNYSTRLLVSCSI